MMKIFSYIRSFHASRRHEPISDGSVRNIFLGCLIEFAGLLSSFVAIVTMVSNLANDAWYRTGTLAHVSQWANCITANNTILVLNNFYLACSDRICSRFSFARDSESCIGDGTCPAVMVVSSLD